MGTGRLGGGGGGGSARGGGGSRSSAGARSAGGSKGAGTGGGKGTGTGGSKGAAGGTGSSDGGGGAGGSFNYTFSGDGVSPGSDPGLDAAAKYVREKLMQLPKDYVHLQFGNPFLSRVYNDIFFFKTAVVDGNSWNAILGNLGVTAGRGCLRDWVSKVVALREGEDIPQKNKIMETVRMALEDFMLSSLGKQDELFFTGDSANVTAALRNKTNREYFDKIPGFFLRQIIWRVVEREREPLQPAVELRLADACEDKAKAIIVSFERNFKHQQVDDIQNVTRQSMFDVFATNTDWLIENFKN